MFSIRLHLLKNPKNRLVRVSSSPGTLMRCSEKRQCIRSHYTSNTILEQTATQVHVETVSKHVWPFGVGTEQPPLRKQYPMAVRCPLRSSTGCFGYLSKNYSTYARKSLSYWSVEIAWWHFIGTDWLPCLSIIFHGFLRVLETTLGQLVHLDEPNHQCQRICHRLGSTRSACHVTRSHCS